MLANPEFAALTLSSLAGMLGIDRRTLYNWRKLPEFQKYVDSIRKTLFENQRKAVDAKLFEKAKEGDNAAMRLFYELGGFLVVSKGDEQELDGFRIVIERAEPTKPDETKDKKE
ncbi:MAG: hypothetical protein K2X01_11375 [Cyanobacteria bacterium]|nr:hypothetical protein [Cyanobacteriota bacterium]